MVSNRTQLLLFIPDEDLQEGGPYNNLEVPIVLALWSRALLLATPPTRIEGQLQYRGVYRGCQSRIFAIMVKDEEAGSPIQRVHEVRGMMVSMKSRLFPRQDPYLGGHYSLLLGSPDCHNFTLSRRERRRKHSTAIQTLTTPQSLNSNPIQPYDFPFSGPECAPMPFGASVISNSSSFVAFPPGPLCSLIDFGILLSSSGAKSTTKSSLTAKTVSVDSQGSSLG